MSSNILQAPLTDGKECGDPTLGICQQSVCINNTCVFEPDQFALQEPCLCGYCVECNATSVNCGANCQYFPPSANLLTQPKPTSLLLAAPCQYDVLMVEIDNGCYANFTRDESGYFNITKPTECLGGSGKNTALNSRVRFYGYGDPLYNETTCPDPFTQPEFCLREDGTFEGGSFEIHSA